MCAYTTGVWRMYLYCYEDLLLCLYCCEGLWVCLLLFSKTCCWLGIVVKTCCCLGISVNTCCCLGIVVKTCCCLGIVVKTCCCLGIVVKTCCCLGIVVKTCCGCICATGVQKMCSLPLRTTRSSCPQWRLHASSKPLSMTWTSGRELCPTSWRSQKCFSQFRDSGCTWRQVGIFVDNTR